jgi:hypothetical protein
MPGAKHVLLLSYFAKELALAEEELHGDQEKEASCQLDDSEPAEQETENKSINETTVIENADPAPSLNKTQPPFNPLSSITTATYLEWVLDQIADQSSLGRDKGSKQSLSDYLGEARLEKEAVALLTTLGTVPIQKYDPLIGSNLRPHFPQVN